MPRLYNETMTRIKEKKEKRTNHKDAAQRISTRTHLHLTDETKKSVTALVFVCVALIFTLSAFGLAGPAGRALYRIFDYFLGIGYFIVPALLFLTGFFSFFSFHIRLRGVLVGGLIILLSGLGFVDTLESGRGGVLGIVGGLTEKALGASTSLLVNFFIFITGILITFNTSLKVPWRKKEEAGAKEKEEEEEEETRIVSPVVPKIDASGVQTSDATEVLTPPLPKKLKKNDTGEEFVPSAHVSKKYVPPPLSLLDDSTEHPSSGDIKANANTIRRTLLSFSIPVEVEEVHVGPKITRYSLKPAEGVKLSKIVTLQNDLALALAAHPIRIEAPIPGKSLVGVEVPNKASALVRLKHVMALDVFKTSGPLGFAIGKDVSGEGVFADISKMPHLLIAGSSGSGKSVVIHSLLVSMLYKNSPETLRVILIDPKRVELSLYNDIPHIAAPVITDPKKAILALKFAIQEMENRYSLLLEKKSRDIFSYNRACVERGEPTIPFFLIIIDELADLMATFPREIEASVVRLAQMARATGIHLVVSTQRPSVEVVTGLIKANITSRIALQVASQVDSRTILDTAGAEKLLGGGDLLYISGELSKPKRIQGAFLSEKEVKKVVDFIKAHNAVPEESIGFDLEQHGDRMMNFEGADFVDEGDPLYNEAVEAVMRAKKASASLLQRRLKVGYARAARLLDIMEEHGIVGPADGAKPREVYVNSNNSFGVDNDAEDDGEDYLNS